MKLPFTPNFPIFRNVSVGFLLLLLSLPLIPVESQAARSKSRLSLDSYNDTLGLPPVASVRLPKGSGLRQAPKAPARPAFRGPLLPLDRAWKPLMQRLVADGFERGKVETLFTSLGPQSYSPAYMAAKIAELHGVGGIGINRSGNSVPELPENYEQPLSDVTVGSCLEFIKNHSEILAAIEDRHGVPAHVVIAVLLVETGLGLDLGSDTALRALAGMAATTTPALLGKNGNAGQAQRVRPAALAATLKNKSDWAYNEVKALIRYADQVGADAAKIPGSIYGAIGICQFMPSNIEPYGVDGDNDGKIDLFSAVDAMYSVANYLEAHGWHGAGNASQRFAVIRAYNHDNFYAARVLGVSNHVGRAIAGKVHPGRSATAGIGPVPASALDPSLRRAKRGGPKIKGLGSYQGLLE